MPCPLISLLHQARLDQALTWTGTHTYSPSANTGRLVLNTGVEFPESATGLISSGAVSVYKSVVQLESESGTADDLDTVSVAAGTSDGFVVFMTAKVGHTITLKHGTGNIKTQKGFDVLLTDAETVLLRYSATDTSWHVIGDSAGIGGESLVSGIALVTLAYNAGAADNGRILIGDTSGGNGTINLPSSGMVFNGYTVGVLHSVGDTNTLTISRGVGDTIGGAAANRTLAVSGAGYILSLRGTDWVVIGIISPTLPIPITLGGTGAATSATALANLGAEATANKDAANGYAGLNAVSRITKGAITTDDLIVDSATKGLVLKDTQGTPHYWRITIDNTGALVSTDLGTSAP